MKKARAGTPSFGKKSSEQSQGKWGRSKLWKKLSGKVTFWTLIRLCSFCPGVYMWTLCGEFSLIWHHFHRTEVVSLTEVINDNVDVQIDEYLKCLLFESLVNPMSVSRAKRRITYVTIINISDFKSFARGRRVRLIPRVSLLPGLGTNVHGEWEIFSSPEFFCGHCLHENLFYRMKNTVRYFRNTSKLFLIVTLCKVFFPWRHFCNWSPIVFLIHRP